jgi:hypothetical protein
MCRVEPADQVYDYSRWGGPTIALAPTEPTFTRERIKLTIKMSHPYTMIVSSVLLVALWLGLNGGTPALAQENDGTPSTVQAISGTTIPCPVALPAGEVEGETVLCGQIEVPQNWDEPDGITIMLTYAVMRATSEAPFADPVLFFEGGPGESGIATFPELTELFSGLRTTRDVIIWDQRRRPTAAI